MRATTATSAGWRWAALAVAFGMAASCSKSHPTEAAQPAAPSLVATAAAVPPPAEGQHGAGKSRGGAFRESAVYVDGQAKGVLLYSELPPTLTPVAVPAIDGLNVPRYYRVADYLKAIGVDLDKIEEVQFYASHGRIAVVKGEELRAKKDLLVFDFTRQVGGKPRARWSALHALPHRPMVDIIFSVAVYVTKPAPLVQHHELWLDGKVVDDPIPYVGDGIPKGTRVYVDGRLAGWVKRKMLPNKLIAPGSEEGHARFSTDALLAFVGADTRHAKAIDFYDQDNLLARVDAKSWAQDKDDYVFELPRRSHGQVEELFPGDKSARISSVQLYVHTTPPARQPDPDAFAQQEGGSDDAQSGGGNGDGSGGNNEDSPSAQGVNDADGDEL
jgi:hypothetical protein